MRKLIALFITALLAASCQTSPSIPDQNPTSTKPEITDTIQPEVTPTLTSTPEVSPTTPPPSPTAPPPTEIPPATPQGNPLPALKTGNKITLTQVEMVDNNRGWGIGTQNEGDDHILYTRDGGKTWQDISPPVNKPEGVQKLQAWGYFDDHDTAWVTFAGNEPPPVGPKVVWKTTNAGEEWQASSPLPLTGQEPFFDPEEFSFVNQDQGWLLVHVDAGMSHDYSHLYHTADGGLTWERIVDPYRDVLQGLENTGMAFASENFGWVTKNNLGVLPGTFLEQTTDGGRQWENIFLPPPQDFNWEEEPAPCKTFQPVFTSPQTGLVLVQCQVYTPNSGASDQQNTLNYVYATSDRGESWQYSKLPSPVNDLEFIDLQTGFAAGLDIYQTTNGGGDWELIKTVTWQGQLSFVNDDLGWAVARKGEEIALVKSLNGGNTWQLIEPQTVP